MSTKGIYTAMSGALAQSTKLDTIANNIANASTPGFKKDAQVFREYLTNFEKEPSITNTPKVPASIESFYDHQGADKSFVDSAGTYTDFAQGPLKITQGNLDVALTTPGFFEVFTPAGLRFTRNGSFKIDGSGQLVTKDGHPVLRAAEAGADPATRSIRVSGSAAVSINDNGDITEGGEVIARLSVIDVAQKQSLKKVGNGYYNFNPAMAPEVTLINNPQLRSGFIEMSNVDIVREMTDMIATTRTFESLQKAMTTYDGMNEKLINQVGSVR